MKNKIVGQGLAPAVKKALSLLLAIAMLFSITAGIDLSVYAGGLEPDIITSGDYEYFDAGSYEGEITSNIVICNYLGKASNLTFPSKLDGKKVIEIANCFSENNKVTSITVPSSVIRIGYTAFESFSNLKSITIQNKNVYFEEIICYNDATIYGYKGSTAETYAKKYGHKFVALSETTKLSTPTLKGTVNANGSFTLSWNKIAGAEKYGIYTKQSNGTYKWVKTVTGTSWTTGTAQYGQQYSYSVLAVTGNISSKYSNVVTVKNTKKLQTPTLKGVVNANGSFTLSWSKISGATKYGIYYKNANGTYTWVKTVTGTTWSTATAQYGKKYTYKVIAVNGNVSSAYSNAVNVTNNKKLQTPTLKATVNKNGSFKLSWNKVTGAEKYGIYVKQSNGSYKWVKTVTGTTYTTGVAKKGTTYTYKVVAVTSKNKNATSNYSSAVSVKR